MSSRPGRILVLDYWSDHNRGDAAMQVGLLRLLRDRCPDADITVMSAFGFNQMPDVVAEMDESAPLSDAVVGGFRPTFAPLQGQTRNLDGTRRRARTAGSLLVLPALALLVLVASRSALLRRLVPGELGRSVDALARADLVVWNGRNFRSDSAKREPYEFFQLLFNPWLAVLAGVPMGTLGLSVWPPKTAIGHRVLTATLRRCLLVTAREAATYDVVRSWFPDDEKDRVRLLPDLSLASVVSVPARRTSRPTAPSRFALTVVDWKNSGQAARDRYVDSVTSFVSSTLAADPEARFTLYPQVTLELESTEALFQEIRSLDPQRVEIARDTRTVDQLVRAYAACDLLIATRMHSAIFATCAGTPVVTIPYDAGAKWGILDMLGQTGTSIDYTEVTPQRLHAKVEEMWSAFPDREDAIARAVETARRDVAEHVGLLVERASQGTT